MVKIRFRGEELNKKELQEIYSKLVLTNHAKEMIDNRKVDNEKIDLKKLFEKPYIAYFNTDGSVNVALNDYNYLVVAKSRREKDKWVAITWKEQSWYDKTVLDKQQLAKLGIDRKL